MFSLFFDSLNNENADFYNGIEVFQDSAVLFIGLNFLQLELAGWSWPNHPVSQPGSHRLPGPAGGQTPDKGLSPRLAAVVNNSSKHFIAGAPWDAQTILAAYVVSCICGKILRHAALCINNT